MSEAWAEQVHRSGMVEIGEFTQAQLLAAGVRHADPSIPRSSPTRFEQLDEAERAAQIDRARREDPGDPEALRLITAAATEPLFSGSWDKSPSSFLRQGAGDHIYLDGMDLADGSPGVLAGLVDPARSRWRYSVHELGELPRRLARSLFEIKDPHAPEEAIEVANGGLALVWPAGRWEARPREILWLLVCPTSGSRAHLETHRNFGFRRSERVWQGLLGEEELAGRMLELFEQCAREGGRRR